MLASTVFNAPITDPIKLFSAIEVELIVISVGSTLVVSIVKTDGTYEIS